ncbi:MAG: hypothetical protein ACK2UW_17575 [Anaerolineales bacterium]|jgi:hypothetical protein
MRNHWIFSVYRSLLFLFPARYRDEFGEELLYAVRMSVRQAQDRGSLAVLRLAWRELRDLPAACMRAYWQERRDKNMKLHPGAYLPEGPFKLWQLAAVFLPFTIPLVGVAIGPSARAGYYGLLCGLGMTLLGLLVVVWIAGLRNAFPTWALPALGLILLAVIYGAYYLAQGLTLIILKPLWGGFWPDAIALRLLMFGWFNLVLIAVAAGIVLVLLNLSPQLLQHARQDWSLLSLFLYSLAIPYIIMNDEYRGLEPYELASLLILITGALLFVILPFRWTRLLALLTATLLALPILSAGIYVIFPEQYFANEVMSFRVWEALQPVLHLPALLIILCLPILVRQLPASFGFKHTAAAA